MKKFLSLLALPLAGAAALALGAPAQAAPSSAKAKAAQAFDDPIPTFDYSHCPALPAGADPATSSCFNAVVTSGRFQVGAFDQQLTSPISLTFASFHANHKYTTAFGALTADKMLVRPGIFGDPILTAVYAKPEYVSGFATNNFAVDMKMQIRLTNPFLGGKCIIGRDDPIDLHLTTGTTNPPAPNGPISGSPATIISHNPDIYKLTDVDNAFSVSGAKGCALQLGLVDAVVNNQAGVPAAAGKNTMIFNEYASFKTYDKL